MTKLSTLTLKGASGQTYDFTVYSYDTEFNAVGAVYEITHRKKKPEGNYNHAAIYIGETSDLSTRFDGHHATIRNRASPNTARTVNASTWIRMKIHGARKRRTSSTITIRPATTSPR